MSLAKPRVGKRRLLLGLLCLLDVLAICFIFVRSSKTAVVSSEESDGFLFFFQQFLPGITEKTVRKLAHFTEFFVLGGLFACTCAVWRRPLLAEPFLAAAATACIDETIQLSVPGRSGQLRDIALDACGALAAVLLLWVLARLRARRREKNQKKSKAK